MTPGEHVAAVLAARTYQFICEADLQQLVAAALSEAGISYGREIPLSRRDRIDLMAGRVGVECKIAGQAGEVWRQLHRYAEHPSVDELVLVTARLRLAAAAPRNVGVPLYVVRVPDGIT